MATTPSNKKIAITVTLEGVNKILDNIAAITQAQIASGKSITKNYLAQIALMDDVLRKQTLLALGAMRMGEASDSALSGMQKGFVIFGTAASNAINHLAGGFSWLSSIIGGLGGLIGGSLIGGPGGGAIGTAIGSIGGSLLGAFANIPIQIVKSVFGVIGSGIETVINGFKSIGSAINNLIFGPVSLFGLVLGSSFKNIGEGISQTVKEVWEASSAFQQLAISIETLTKREVARQAGIEISQVTEEQLKGQTQDLFNWLTKVSLTSPFTMKSIADAMKFASAMGLSIDMTKNLTLATGNFSAAMGLTEDHQYRIMYNLAQIYQQGKLTGREFRDLAISFVPVYDILSIMAKEAGMTTEAFKKLALEGGIPVEDFFTHFIDYMNTNFPDSMAKMSRTMIGVRNNFKDFIQVVMGMEVLGPVLDRISGKLADVLEGLLSPRTHRIAKDFGQGLLLAFNSIEVGVNKLTTSLSNLWSALGFGTPTIEGLARAFTKLYLNASYAIEFISKAIDTIVIGVKQYVVPVIAQLGKISDNGEGWGSNLIFNFAKGMIQGVAKFLAKAIIYISAFIHAFFAPGSPPKVAPKIDLWGAQMMGEWINGAVNITNWNALGNGVANKVQGQIAGLYKPPEPQMGTVDTGPEGTPTQDYKASLKDTVKKTVDSVVQFVTEQGMRLAASLMKGFSEGMFDALDAIQSPLKSALDALAGLGMIGETQGLEMYYDFSQDLIKSLDEFNKTGEISQHLLSEIGQLGMGLGPELVDLIMAEFGLAKAVQDAELAQKRLNDAVNALGQARGNVHKLVRDYNALLRAGADRKVLKTKLGELNTAEKVVKQAEIENSLAESNKKVADERVTQMKEQASLQNKLVDNMLELLKIQTDAISGAKGGADGLTESLDDLASSIGNLASGELELPIIDFDKLKKELEPDIKAMWDALGGTFNTSFTEALNSVATQDAANKLMENLKKSINKTLGLQIEAKPTYPAPHPGAMLPTPEEGEIIPPSTGFAPAGSSYFQQLVDAIFGGQVNWEKAIGNITTTLTGIVSKALVNMTSSIFEEGTVANNLYDFCVQMGLAVIGGIAEGLVAGIVGWATSNPDKAKLVAAIASGNPVLISQAIAPIVSEAIMGKLLDTAGGGKSKPKTSIEPEIDISPTFNPPLTDVGGGIATDIKDGAAEEFEKLTWGAPVEVMVQNVVDAMQEKIEGKSPAKRFNPIGISIVDGIIEGIKSQILVVVGPAGAIYLEMQKIIDGIKKFLGIGSEDSSSNPFYTAGQSIVQGLINGFNSMIQTLKEAWNALIRMIPGNLADEFLMESPSKLMEKMGENIVNGLAIGIEKSKQLVKIAMDNVSMNVPTTNIATSRATYVPYTRVGAPSITKNTYISFGDVNLSNGMDWNVFKAQVQRAIVED